MDECKKSASMDWCYKHERAFSWCSALRERDAALLQVSALQEECQDLRNLKERLIKEKFTEWEPMKRLNRELEGKIDAIKAAVWAVFSESSPNNDTAEWRALMKFWELTPTEKRNDERCSCGAVHPPEAFVNRKHVPDVEPYNLPCGCYLKLHPDDLGGVGVEEVRCAKHG